MQERGRVYLQFSEGWWSGVVFSVQMGENKIVYLETVIKYLDGVLKSIAGRGWDIKNAIQWKNFEAGLM